jgi:hypothetical protein
MADCSTEEFLDSLVYFLRNYQYRYIRESQLQEGVEQVFGQRKDWSFHREHALSPQDRPDFWFPGQGVAVELKTGGSLTLLTRQLQRYALLPEVRGLVLVTPLRRLCALPGTLAGVPLRVAYLENSVF